MTGRGKGGVRRHKKFPAAMKGVTKTAIRRLARRGGVKRIPGLTYDKVRDALMSFLEKVIQDAVCHTSNGNRKTVSVFDVLKALELKGISLYNGIKG